MSASPTLARSSSRPAARRPGRDATACGTGARRFLAPDPAATRTLAARLATAARPGDVLALDGPLGAGKTEFARGFAAGLGVAGHVSSPSFVLMAEHEGRLPLFHLDGYRLAGPDDAWASGLLDERRAEGVTVVEWASRFGPALPAGRLEITIDGAGDEPRTVILRGTDRRHRQLLEDAMGLAGKGGPDTSGPAGRRRGSGR